MNYPKISIVTPSYNQVKFIEETILSVLGQNYPDLEYFIIDGGSTDGTIDIIRRYEGSLAGWISEKDNGMYDALQKGFARATGDVMLWLNSDDLLHPGALHNVAEIFERFPQVSWISGINIRFDEKSRVIGASPAKKFSRFGFCLHEYKWIQQESTAWRRSLWDRAGSHIETSATLAGDLELWSRFIEHELLYPCDILVGGFRSRSEGQLSVTNEQEYNNEARRFIAGMYGRMNASDRRKVIILKSIRLLKMLLRYSIVFDWRVFGWLFRKVSDRIHRYPHRIAVDRKSLRFEFVR